MSPLGTALCLGAGGGAVTAVAIFAANAQARRKPWASYTSVGTYLVVVMCYPVLGACMAGFGQMIGTEGSAALAGFTGLAALSKLAVEAREAEPPQPARSAPAPIPVPRRQKGQGR
jgi:hypothetical protein